MQGPVRRTDNADPTSVQRWDRVEMPALDPATRTPQGYLIVHASVAKPGVYDYIGPDGTVVKELVRAETLHDAASLTTLAGIPVTLTHPDEDVTPDNVGELGVGVVGPTIEVLAKTGHVRVTKVIQDRRGLDALAAGVVEASLGYMCPIIDGGGEHPEFGRYDQEQGPRIYNHSAIVPEGRHGETVRLRVDSGDRQAVNRYDSAPAEGEWRRVRLDSAPAPTPAPPKPTPTPAPQARRDSMPLYLFAIAAILGLGVTRRDEKLYRNDQEITQEQLVAAVTEAIQKLQGEAAANEPAEGELTPEQMQAKISELTAELETMRTEKADQEKEEEEKLEKADRATLDALAKRMRFDTRAWTKDTTSDERRLALLKHAKFDGIDADAVLRTDAKPSGLDPVLVRGMAQALPQMYPEAGGQPRRQDHRPLAFPPKPPKAADPTIREDDAPPADPHRAWIEKQKAAKSA